MDEDDQNLLGFCTSHPPFLVSLAAFSSPSRRRLSSHFSPPSHPVSSSSSARRLAWVSLQGRVVNAEEASSAPAIKGGLSGEEAAAWELFTPIQRFLIVAVIGVAVAESKKNRVISHLKKSVEFRDQVLLSMQQKLDNLCEQLYFVKDQPGIRADVSSNGKAESPICESFGHDKINFVDCGCWLCDRHHDLFNGLEGHSAVKTSGGDEMLQYKMNHANETEQEERRMSDLSDWASSVTSTAEIQMLTRVSAFGQVVLGLYASISKLFTSLDIHFNPFAAYGKQNFVEKKFMNSIAIEQDFFNLRKECEEKDATIKELTTFIQSSNVTGSKRISELEEIIRRKNMIITRLKKDMVVLEQKVVQLTRLQRPSSTASASASASKCWQLPVMADNLLYDMDSTTSPSSSESDSPIKNRPEAPVAKDTDSPLQNRNSVSTSDQKSAPPKVSSSLVKPTNRHTKSRSVSPLKERSTNQNSGTLSSLRQKQLSARGELKKSRRRTQSTSKVAAQQKRWA
ncbi:hypothetical protein JRO89_XS10G0037300 [Xanthoceras sorbifolium]|uniref:Uncharacterized protein n=1 Tax=Xanthoceras sorbifolium TaxID=99658 RepID=A0ABQ8HHG3_9ROSI|nr:hypothetical protein JRO89_XS10G0037300 [Xanthoceras sorbifolium]